MNNFLLVGPAGIGKSVAANRIANALGCTSIKYEWNGIDELDDYSLAVGTFNIDLSRVDTSTIIFVANSSEALQTLVKGLEHQPITPKQLSIEKQLADIACWLHVAKLHCLAEYLAGDRKAEIYRPEDATPAAQTCSHHPV